MNHLRYFLKWRKRKIAYVRQDFFFKTPRGFFSCFNLKHKIKLARFGTHTITEPNLDVR